MGPYGLQLRLPKSCIEIRHFWVKDDYTYMTEITGGLDEISRLADLYRTQLLDTPPEPELDALVLLGARVFNTAYCLISLVDRDRLWFKAKAGLAVCEAGRSVSFCTHTIQSDEPYTIDDASIDPLYQGNPLVEGELKLRSYLGIPLHSSNGSRIGSFCVLDIAPRSWTDTDVQVARKMANLAELLLHKGNSASAARSVKGTELRAGWTRDLSGDKVIMDITLSRLLGFTSETAVTKDWFTRQVFDCDRERVLEERSRASGEFFDYQMGLSDGTVLSIREQVRIVCDETTAQKRGCLNIHVMSRANDWPGDRTMPDQLELLVWPDHSACYLPDRKSTKFRFFDILHPANIADFLHACKSVRNQGGVRALTVQIKNKANYYSSFSASLSWVDEHMDLSDGFFRLTLNRVLLRPELDLKCYYDSSLSNAFKSLPGFFYHRATGRVHLSSKLQSLLGTPGDSPCIDEVITSIEAFSGLNFRDEITFCLENSISKRIEFKQLSFGVTRWYQMVIDIQEDRFTTQPNLSFFLVDITESRAARLDAEMNNFTRDLVLQNVSDGVLELDETYSIVFANRQARLILFGQAEVFKAGVSVRSIFSGLSQKILQQAMVQLKYEGASDGHDLFVPSTGKMVKVRFIRGNHTNYCVLNEITALRRVAQQLEMATQTLSIIDSPVAVLEAKKDSPNSYGFVYLNHAFQSIFGIVPGATLKTAPEWFAQAVFGHSGKRKLSQSFMKWVNATIPLSYADKSGRQMSCIVEVRPITEKLTLQRNVLVVMRNIVPRQ